MSENRLSNRNVAIQEMLASGEKIHNFYRFVAQNPHISLNDACQIVVNRPNASVCFSIEEWNAMGRRVTRGKQGIQYYEADGSRRYVFDANDTYGETRYKRFVYPIKRLLQGLDVLNGTDKYSDLRGDYRKIHDGVAEYLKENGHLTDDEERNRLILEGTAYSLYCKTGFPKNNGIVLHGMPYDLTDNADLFKEICSFTNFLHQEIEEAYLQAQNEVQVINDVDEETISDEPIITEQSPVAQTVDEPQVTPYYKDYLDAQKKYPDSIILIRLGDFYEMMGECAKIASEELDLTLTGRNVGLPERVPMCGIPYHATDKYIEKLLKNHSVVVVEGEEEPKYIQSYVETLEQSVEAEIDYDESVDEEEDWDSAVDEQDMPIEQDAIRPQEKPKQQKRIKDRKRKNSSQMSIFDMFGKQPDISEEEDRREAFIKSQLQRGSGFEYGKFRIAETYSSNPTLEDFAEMLKKEYGIGGYGSPDGDSQMHDAKGLRAKFEDKANPQNNIEVNLKWNEVATRIADLIDEGEYFTANQAEQYAEYLAERTGSDEERNNAIANNIIKRIWDRQADGYFRVNFSYCYAGYGYAKDHSSEIVEILKSKSDIDDAYIRSDAIYLYGKELKSAKERLREQDSPQNKINAIVDRIIEEGTQNTTEGNWIAYFSEFGAEEQFIKEHKDEIADEIGSREEVSDVMLTIDGFDVNYYTNYTENLLEEEETEEVIEQPRSAENTDLNAVGFDQNELGGG